MRPRTRTSSCERAVIATFDPPDRLGRPPAFESADGRRLQELSAESRGRDGGVSATATPATSRIMVTSRRDATKASPGFALDPQPRGWRLKSATCGRDAADARCRASARTKPHATFRLSSRVRARRSRGLIDRLRASPPRTQDCLSAIPRYCGDRVFLSDCCHALLHSR